MRSPERPLIKLKRKTWRTSEPNEEKHNKGEKVGTKKQKGYAVGVCNTICIDNVNNTFYEMKIVK